MAFTSKEGTIASSTTSAWFPIKGYFELILSGTWVGTVALERKDSAVGTAVPVSRDYAGTPFSVTQNGIFPFEERLQGKEYRLNFTRTSGTVVFRFEEKDAS